MRYFGRGKMQAAQGQEQRQHPRFGLGLPVTLLFGAQKTNVPGELQDISAGGCFFKSRIEVDIDRRILVVLRDTSGKICRAKGRVVRTLAYRGFAVLFDDPGSRAVAEFIRGFGPLTPSDRVARLSTGLVPQIEIL
jgi:hypothetical protein